VSAPTLGRIVHVFVNEAWHAAIVTEVPTEFAPHLVRSALGPDVEAFAVVPFPQTEDFKRGALRTILWVPKDEERVTADGHHWRWPPRE
jgi:hypothetical protein